MPDGFRFDRAVIPDEERGGEVDVVYDRGDALDEEALTDVAATIGCP